VIKIFPDAQLNELKLNNAKTSAVNHSVCLEENEMVHAFTDELLHQYTLVKRRSIESEAARKHSTRKNSRVYPAIKSSSGKNLSGTEESQSSTRRSSDEKSSIRSSLTAHDHTNLPSPPDKWQLSQYSSDVIKGNIKTVSRSQTPASFVIEQGVNKPERYSTSVVREFKSDRLAVNIDDQNFQSNALPVIRNGFFLGKAPAYDLHTAQVGTSRNGHRDLKYKTNLTAVTTSNNSVTTLNKSVTTSNKSEAQARGYAKIQRTFIDKVDSNVYAVDPPEEFLDYSQGGGSRHSSDDSPYATSENDDDIDEQNEDNGKDGITRYGFFISVTICFCKGVYKL